MSVEVSTQEILKRLQALEEENARLRKATIPGAPKPVVVTEGEYMGHPTLTFEGPCKPFTIGLKKLSVVKEVWPQVEKFIESHSNGSVKKESGNNGELQI